MTYKLVEKDLDQTVSSGLWSLLRFLCENPPRLNQEFVEQIYRAATKQSGGIDEVFHPATRYRPMHSETWPEDGESVVFWREGALVSTGGRFKDGLFFADGLQVVDSVVYWLSLKLIPLPENEAVAFPS